MARNHGTLLNMAMVPGTMMIDCAKMIGITPAELIRIGMNVFCPSRMRPRPITLRGIWIGMRRAATVIAITPVTTPIMTVSNTSKLNSVIASMLNSSSVRNVPGMNPSMMEKKIMRLIPFPTPRSVIRSPSHITKMAPVVSVNMVIRRKPNPGSGTARCCSAKMAKP